MSHSKEFKIFAALLALVVALSAFAACGKKDDIKPDDTSAPSQTEAPAVSGDINPLTGLSGLSESAQGKRPVAVVVENSPEARPQWGLCSPDVVIEGLAEGGITRMLWLYSDISKAGKIGPTRSARHNFVEMAASFDAIYVHFGGSYVAYNLFSSDSSLNHIDGNKERANTSSVTSREKHLTTLIRRANSSARQFPTRNSVPILTLLTQHRSISLPKRERLQIPAAAFRLNSRKATSTHLHIIRQTACITTI